MKIGKISDTILKRSVLKPLKSVCVKENDSIKMSTVTVTVDTMLSVYIGIHKSVNGVLVQGAIPKYISINISLTKDAEEHFLKDVMRYVSDVCKKLNVSVSCGHTEVITGIDKSIMVITCAGMSEERENFVGTNTARNKPESDMQIVMTKAIGIEGTAIIEEKFHEKLLERFSESFLLGCNKFRANISIAKEIELANILKDESGKKLVTEIINVSGGGIFAALWHTAEKTSHGVEAYLKDIPVWQETIELTELYDINPYQMASAGAVLMVTHDGKLLVEELGKNGVPASIIGRLTDNNDKVVINGDEKRFLDSPKVDEIHKIDQNEGE